MVKKSRGSSKGKKKVAKRKPAKKKSVSPKAPQIVYRSSDENLVKSLIARDEVLVDNFVGLQKALVNMSIKFNELTERMDKLLEIYQRAADVFIQKQIRESDHRVELDRKVNNVMQQNKVLARRQTMAPPMPNQNQGSSAPMPSQGMSSMPGGTPSITNTSPSQPQSQGIVPPAPQGPESTKPRPLPTI